MSVGRETDNIVEIVEVRSEFLPGSPPSERAPPSNSKPRSATQIVPEVFHDKVPRLVVREEEEVVVPGVIASEALCEWSPVVVVP